MTKYYPCISLPMYVLTLVRGFLKKDWEIGRRQESPGWPLCITSSGTCVPRFEIWISPLFVNKEQEIPSDLKTTKYVTLYLRWLRKSFWILSGFPPCGQHIAAYKWIGFWSLKLLKQKTSKCRPELQTVLGNSKQNSSKVNCTGKL